MKKARQETETRTCASNCNADVPQVCYIALGTDETIAILNAMFYGELTTEKAAVKLCISEDETEALMDGFFWSPTPVNTQDDGETLKDPEMFESRFLQYIEITNVNKISDELKQTILIKLDDLLFAFPFETFPELCSTHFEWADTTRFVLENIPDCLKLPLLHQLRDEFWRIYSHKMRTVRDVAGLRARYYKALEVADKKIGEVREELLSEYHVLSDENMKYVTQLAQGAMNASQQVSKSLK